MLIPDGVDGPGGPLASYPLGTDVQHLARTLYFMFTRSYPDLPYDPLPEDVGRLGHVLHNVAITSPFLYPDRFKTPDDFLRAINRATEDPQAQSMCKPADLDPSTRAKAVAGGIADAVRQNNRFVALWIGGPALLVVLALVSTAALAGGIGWAGRGTVLALLGIAALVLVVVTALCRRWGLFLTVQEWARRVGQRHGQANLVRSVLDLQRVERAPFVPALLDPDLPWPLALRVTCSQVRHLRSQRRMAFEAVRGTTNTWIDDRLTLRGLEAFRESPPLPCEGIAPRASRAFTWLLAAILFALVVLIIVLFLYWLFGPQAPPEPGDLQTPSQSRTEPPKAPENPDSPPAIDPATQKAIDDANQVFKQTMQSVGPGQPPSGSKPGGRPDGSGGGASPNPSGEPGQAATTQGPAPGPSGGGEADSQDSGPEGAGEPPSGSTPKADSQPAAAPAPATQPGVGKEEALNPAGSPETKKAEPAQGAETGWAANDSEKKQGGSQPGTEQGEAPAGPKPTPEEIRKQAMRQLEEQRGQLETLKKALEQQAQAPGTPPDEAQRLEDGAETVQEAIAKQTQALKVTGGQGPSPERPAPGGSQPGTAELPPDVHDDGTTPPAPPSPKVVQLPPLVGEGDGPYQSPEPPQDVTWSPLQRRSEAGGAESRIRDPVRRGAIRALVTPPSIPPPAPTSGGTPRSGERPRSAR
jgi:hypothetical protein